MMEPNQSNSVLVSSSLAPPSDGCFVCQRAAVTIRCDTQRMTLQQLVDWVLRGKLHVNEPEISLGTSILLESGDDADEELQEHLPKHLASLPAGGVVDGTILDVEDFRQDLCITVRICHCDADSTFDPEKTAENEMFEILKGVPSSSSSSATSSSSSSSSSLEGRKRKREDDVDEHTD